MTAKAKRTSNARLMDEAPAQWMRTGDLRAWPGNPRMNDDNVARVAESIKRFGFSAPIVARRETCEIIAGHTRWLAAQSLGMEQVPVRLMDLSEREAHMLALADNRLNELAPWETQELQQLLSELSLQEAELCGWTQGDLERMASDLLDESGEGSEDDQGKEPCALCGRA